VKKDWPTSIRSSRRVQGWAWEGEELTGGGVPTADRSGGGEELVGERFPGEEGGQVLVQQLQQEERKLLGGGSDRSEEGRRDEFDGNRNSPARRWQRRGGSGGWGAGGGEEAAGKLLRGDVVLLVPLAVAEGLCHGESTVRPSGGGA
jgi:hypothetical protein